MMGHQPGNISAGTQVVSLIEVRGPSDSLVHPRGAVGVVTRTPAGEERHYRHARCEEVFWFVAKEERLCA